MAGKGKRKVISGFRPLAYIFPSFLLIGLIVIFPIGYTVYISFTNMSLSHMYEFQGIGFQNYYRALFVIDSGFWRSLFLTLLWTAINMALQLVIAYIVAVLLNSPNLQLKKLYKTLLMIPWALPGYVSILVWKNGIFNSQFGFLNKVLAAMGVGRIEVLSDDVSSFIACTIVNLWLALPFMIMIIDGALQSINKEHFEAAELDGCNRVEKSIFVTIPLITPIIWPAVLITIFTTFKTFDVINLMTISPSPTGAHIETVIVYAYENAFITNNYGFSSAISVLIFLLIAFVTVFSDSSFRIKKKGNPE
jgi:arabinogalactan oligomer / maltooligosaccharide transport system permease protein